MIKMVRKPEGIIAKVGAVLAVLAVVLAAGCGSVAGAKGAPAKPASVAASSPTSSTPSNHSTPPENAQRSSASGVQSSSMAPPQIERSPSLFSQVLFATTQVGWVTGVSAGTGFAEGTVDGGQQWSTQLQVPSMTADGIAAIQSQTVYVGFHTWHFHTNVLPPEVWYTTDGGTRWSKTILPEVSSNACQTGLSLDFVTTTTGWALCVQTNGVNQAKTLYSTTDSGARWTVVAVTTTANGNHLPLAGFASRMDFTNSENGWIGLTTTCPAQVLETVDGGKTWNPETLPASGVSTAALCSFSLPTVATKSLVVGIVKGPKGIYLYSITPSARNPIWTMVKQLPATIHNILPASSAAVFGTEGITSSAVLSEDQGTTWTSLHLPKGSEITGSPYLASNNTIWAVGTVYNASQLLHGISTNGAWSWHSSPLPQLS